MNNNTRISSRTPLFLAAAAAVALGGCGSQTSNALPKARLTSAYAPPANGVSFKGVRLDPPEGWKVVQASSIASCPPTGGKLLIVGDRVSTAVGADCAAPTGQPQQIWVTTETPGMQGPSSLGPIGSLEGWQQNQSGQGSPRWVVVLPQQTVELTFDGNVSADVRQHVLNGVRAG